MIEAIINQLKTGSVINNVTIGGSESRPVPPYNVVYQDTPNTGGDDRIGTMRIIINTHFPQGNWKERDDYINIELPSLLNKNILLTTTGGRTFRLHTTKEIGPPVGRNDDGTTSRDRVFNSVKFF